MDSTISSFVAALFGAIVGSLTSVLVVVVQERSTRKIDRLRLSIEAGIEDHKAALQIFCKQGGNLAPLSAFIFYSERIISLIENGTLTPENLRKIRIEGEEIMKVIQEK